MSGLVVKSFISLGLICLSLGKEIITDSNDRLFPSNNNLFAKSNDALYLTDNDSEHRNILKIRWDGKIEEDNIAKSRSNVRNEDPSENHQREERFLVVDWMLMMKGVAGAQGPDLYQLWQSNQTLNMMEPLARHLTSEFNGHFKSDSSNHWNLYCIDQVKVSIYNNDVEKAFIVFNATGADKMGWFTDSRIIRSSWSDLKTAKKQLVSMAGNTGIGQEFAIVGHSAVADQCDAFGWIMVSTKSTCFYEMGDSKPSFYYAPGTTQAHWGFTNPSSGDVFAIHAHRTCGPTTSVTIASTVTPPSTSATATPYCTFKGHNYRQGETWKDGCSQKCTCSNADSGTYTCTSLCLSWTGLQRCHVLPAPIGLCCQQVFCPSGTIVIPMAFKDEYPVSANSQYSYI